MSNVPLAHGRRAPVTIPERESFVARLTELTGEPVTRLLRAMPSSVTEQMNRVVHRALHQALNVALFKMDMPEAEASEQMQDVVAEARAENTKSSSASAKSAAS
jgi:hypothetical protein